LLVRLMSTPGPLPSADEDGLAVIELTAFWWTCVSNVTAV